MKTLDTSSIHSTNTYQCLLCANWWGLRTDNRSDFSSESIVVEVLFDHCPVLSKGPKQSPGVSHVDISGKGMCQALEWNMKSHWHGNITWCISGRIQRASVQDGGRRGLECAVS